jgi:broad specificity phosphatase PhoE
MSKLIYLCRHGETEWSRSGQHTSHTDLALIEEGRQQALALKERIADVQFSNVLSSPLRRASETCELTGLASQAQFDPDLVEWNYGDYEGLTTAQIHERDPSWTVFTHPSPGGELIETVTARADRIIERLLGMEGDTALFSHGHFLRVLGARWMELPAAKAAHLALAPAALSMLGFVRNQRGLILWNESAFQLNFTGTQNETNQTTTIKSA